MKNLKIYTLLLAAAVSVAASSCDEGDETSDSVISTYPTYEISTEAGATNITVDETDEDTIRFKVALDPEKQLNDITLSVASGANSTAEEGVDFELAAHDFEVPAFGGQDSIEIEIYVLQDYEPGEGDETIYLTFSTAGPSGLIQDEELLVATIVDSDLSPPIGTDIHFTLRWEFASEEISADACGADVDMTIQPDGGAIYAATDLLAYAAASTACPESGDLTIADMVDGAVYDVWVAIYDGRDFGTLSDINVYIDYSRENTDFIGTIAIEDVFSSTMASAGGVLFNIERNGDVITISDTDGNVVAEGRTTQKSPVLQHVEKRK